MKNLPNSEKSLLIRTSFGDDDAWAEVLDLINAQTDEGFRAQVEVVNDRSFDGATAEALNGLDRGGYPFDFIFVADEKTLSSVEHPILAVRLNAEEVQTFLVPSASLWVAENNLSVGNMGFEEFADNVDENGVYLMDTEF